MANIRDEILKLTNPEPVFKDPEDNSDDETSAKVVDQDVDGFEEITQPSNLRQKTAIILADTDRRYAGRKTSRKNLNSDLTDDSGEESDDGDADSDVDNDERMNDENGVDDDDDSDENEVDDEDEENELNDDDDEDTVVPLKGDVNEKFKKKFSNFGTKEFTFKDDGDYAKYADDDNSDLDSDFDQQDEDDDDDGNSDDQQDASDDDEDDDDSGKGDEDISDEEEGEMDGEDVGSEDEGIQKFSKSATDEVAKGEAAKHQLGLWDAFLEGRIKLQKAVSIVNQLPQKDTWSDFSENSEPFTEEATKAQQALGHLIESLVHLQDLLLHQNAETKHILDENSSAKSRQRQTAQGDIDDDEEITSDSDIEMDIPKEKLVPKTEVRKRKLNMEEYPGFLKKRHVTFREYRDSTIQKWYDKTRLAAGNLKGKSFSAFDQSAVFQINQILADKDRLVRRTQLKRTMYRVLGTQPKPEKQEVEPPQEEDEVMPEKDHLKTSLTDHDTEIFDDDDFYHQLLREFIERKSSDVNDPVALSRQWLKIQKLRSKKKKIVDSKASKGRKVRYDVHKKLTNFMAPVNNSEWSDEARNDLFKSLFGKRFEMDHA